MWHLSLANEAGDRTLTDDEWGDAVRYALDEMGFDNTTAAMCPWVAVRHGRSAGGNDHVHVAVSLVRENGTTASWWNDRVKMSQVCKTLEDRYALAVVGGRHGDTPTRWPERVEFERAQANPSAPQPVAGQPRWTPAQEMAVVVRGCAAASVDEAEFVRRLHDAGYEVRPREAAGDHTQVAGYAVRPVHGDDRAWRAGGKLARDLSLPRLRQDWQPVDDQRAAWRRPDRARHHRGRELVTSGGEGREMQPVAEQRWADAAAWTHEAAEAVRTGQVDPAEVAPGAAGVAAALANRLEGEQPGPLAALAANLAQHPQPDTPGGGGGRYRLLLAGAALIALQGDRRGQTASWLLLLAALADLADAIAELNQSRERLRYAQGVQRATVRVRTETERLVADPDGRAAATANGPPRSPTTVVVASRPAPVDEEALRRARDRHDHRDRPSIDERPQR